MAYTAFDARKIVRSKIGTDAVINGQLEECVVASDTNGATLNIPMYTKEEEKIECPEYPYIVIDLLSISSIPHDICAATRYRTCLVQLDIKFINSDKPSIEVDVFGKVVADKIVNAIRTYQSTTNSIDFMNISNEGRMRIEDQCEDIVFHWIMELDCKLYD